MTKSISVPGQIRRYVLKQGRPAATKPGEVHLYAACEEGDQKLKANEMSVLNTIDLNLTNAALGAALDIARGWLDSDNGNNVMAGKSMLKFELEYEPDDPREIRHEIKMPKSVAGHFAPEYGSPSPYKNESEVIETDMDRMHWVSNGAHGRVRAETLGYLLKRMDRLQYHDHSAVARAAKKFVDTFTEPYEQTQRLITGYLSMDEDQDTTPNFMEAIDGLAPEPEAEPKRLVIVACGGKKSDAPGKLPAEERYTGNYFRACLMAADVMDGPTMILSAKYGFISPSEEIENYNVKMGDKDSVRLGTARKQVEALGLEDAKVTVLGGEKYVEAARQIWPDAEAPLKGGIGQQLKQLAEIYGGEPEVEDQEPEEKAEGPISGGYPGQLRNVMNLPSRGRATEPVIWFGGKAGKRNPKPGKWMKVKIVYTGESKYDLIDLATQDTVLTCTLASQIHWAYVEKEAPALEAPAPVEVEDQEHAEPAKHERPSAEAMEVIRRGASGDYEVPENWIELAEEGNTPQARAYWTRRCDEYRRTGK